MASLFLRRGPLANLAAAPKVDGAISFTTDEPAIYLDVDNGSGTVVRKRVGDIIQIPSIESIVLDKETMTGVVTDKAGLVSEWSDSTLYYAEAENALLKCKKDGATYKWVQINATSEIEGDISNALTRIDTLEKSVQGLNTGLNEVVKTGGLIDTAKQAAIDAAAADATAKADAAQAAAEAKAKEYNDALETSKVSKTEFNSALTLLETKPDAEAKLTAAKAYTDELKNGAVKANADNLAAEITRATGAEEALGSRIDGVVADVGGINTALPLLATKEELNTAKSDLSTAISTAKGEAVSDAQTYTNSVKDALTAEIGSKVSTTDFNNAVSALNTAIETAKTDAATDATNKANVAQAAAEATAAAALATAKAELKTEIDSKVSTSDFNAAVALLETKEDATKKLAEAKKYTDDALAAADAMTFAGVVGGEGNIADLPTSGVKAGDTYKVGQLGEYAGVTAYVGDLFIAKADQGDAETYDGGWFHVSSGYEDDYNAYLTAKDEENTVVLNDAVNKPHGSLKFVAGEGVSITMDSEIDPKTGVADTVVTVGVSWGEF